MDSQQRQAEAEERRRAAEDEERRRRLVEEQRRQEESERQMALIARLLEKSTLDDGRDRKPRERDAQLVRLTDKDDIETYLTTFERVMEAYEVDRNRWTFKLAPYLSGRAQEVYGSLAAEAAANYEQLKEAILVRYGIREETYRMRFRSTKKKAEETYRELGNRLQDTAKKWLRDYESKEELLDVLVKEQFVNSLPTILQVWIREREPETSEAAFDLADSFVHARECGSGNGMGRSGLKNEGPGMDNSQDKPRCFKCGEEGHFAGRCHEQGAKAEQDAVKRQSYRADSSAGSKVKCYNCGKTGHVARRCPESALFAGSRCKDTLLERNVTRRGTVEGTKVQDIILDTGCSRTLVRKDLVPPSKWLEERAVVIKCAHGDAVMYPLASVDLMVDGTAVNVEAALSDTLPAAVLLGRDVPELHRLLQEPRGAGRTSVHGAPEADEAMVVTTRAGARKKPREIEEDSEQGEEQGEEKEKAVRDNSHEQEQWDVGDVLDDDLFVENGRLEKTRLSRSQKRLNRKQFQSGDKNRSTEEETEENMQKAQETQKRWYDRNAREKTLEPGEKVLVLLPTSSNKLLAQWQGPYTVEKRVSDVTYQVDMSNKRKRHRVFHVNMLRQWHDQQPTDSSLWVDDTEEAEDEIPVWGKDDTCVQWNLPPHLDEMQKRSLHGLLKEFEDTLKSKPGRTRMIEHSIHTGSAQAIRLPPYRLPYAYRDVITKELKEMLEDGVISRSTSEWAAPVVLITKKNGEIRFCVDYRRLNSISRTDSYPMPRVDELIDRLGSANYISTLDLSRGYWQVPMSAQSRAKTAFVTSYGLFEFNVMPFGLQGAPSTFQRMMDQLLRGLEDCAAAYLDDLVIHNATWPEHLASLRKVLERLRTAGLTAKPSKCHFAMKECTYLGHIVGNGQVRPEIGKLTAVEDFPVPKTKKEVRTFLGLTGYYRKFVPCYASLAAPLTELTRSNAPTIVIWTTSCNTAFMDLKRLLCSSPVLQCPDFSRPFILQTDASDWGVGGVLSQLDQEGLDHPVAYFSRKLLPRERRYATVEKECLAIKLAIQAFRVYLLGKPFRIVTDHHALEWLDRLKTDNARLTRWSLSLQPYHFTVTYRPGKCNGNADALSRRTSSPLENVEGV